MSAALTLSIRAPTTYAATADWLLLLTVVPCAAAVAVGLVLSWDGPSAQLGRLLTCLGLTMWSPVWVGWEAGPPLARSIAMLLVGLPPVLLAHLCLVVTRRSHEAWAVRALRHLYLAVAAWTLVRAVVRDPWHDRDCWSNCSDNVFLIAPVPGLARALDTGWAVAAMLVGAGVVMLAVDTFRRAGPGHAHAALVLLPCALVAVGIVGRAALLVAAAPEAPELLLYRAAFATSAAGLLLLSTGAAVAYARVRRQRAALARMAESLRDEDAASGVQRTLAVALRDPGLRVDYWHDRHAAFVDPLGRPAAEPIGPSTVVAVHGTPVARVTSRAPRTVPADVLAGVGSAAAVALENARLEAGLRADISELRASRARVVAAADQQRRRLERDLHDGAQQLVVALTFELRQLRAAAAAVGHEGFCQVVDQQLEIVTDLLEELRRLASGLFPPVLGEGRLCAALESLADQSPVPLDLRTTSRRRLPPAVAIAAYFTVAETLGATPSATERVAVAVDVGDVLRLSISPVNRWPGPSVEDRVGALGGTVRLTDGRLFVELSCA